MPLYQRNTGLAVNVRDYGATGNGATDDLAAVEAALAAAMTAKRPLYFPAGTYNLSGTLDARDDGTDSFAGLIGDGREKSILQCTGTNVPAVRLTGRYFKVEGLTVTYQTAQAHTATDANCLQLEDWVFFATFRDLLLKNGARGIMGVEGDNGSQERSVFSCTFDGIRVYDASLDGIRHTNGTGSSWSNIYVSSPGRPHLYSGIYLESVAEDAFNQCNVEHANIRGAAIVAINSAAHFNGLHFEGLRLLGSGTSDGDTIHGAFIYTTSKQLLRVTQLWVDFCFVGPLKVSSLTRDGSTITATLDLSDAQAAIGGSGLRVGDTVTIAGASVADYNASFTVASVPAANQFTATIGTSPATPAVPTSGSDYITAQLGTSSMVATLVRCNNAGRVRVEGLFMRDNLVTGTDSGTRNSMLRIAADVAGRNHVEVLDVLLRLEDFNGPAWPGNLSIVGRSRSSNVATVYTIHPHRLEVGQQVAIGGMGGSGYSVLATINAVPTDYSFSYGNTGADEGLTRETTGTATIHNVGLATRARTSNVATYTTGSAHNFKVGHRVAIRFAGGTGYDDTETVVLSVPDSTTFTVASSGSDEGSTASTGSVMLLDAGLSGSFAASPSTSRAVRECDWLSQGAAVLNFGSVGATSSATLTQAFPNTHVGDLVELSFPTGDPGAVITARATATGTLTFTAYNPTAGSVTVGPILAVFRVRKV